MTYGDGFREKRMFTISVFLLGVYNNISGIFDYLVILFWMEYFTVFDNYIPFNNYNNYDLNIDINTYYIPNVFINELI